MSESKAAYLLGLVEECREGLYRWDDAAWIFIFDITNTGDADLFKLAPDEIKGEIFEIIRLLREQGYYRAIAAGAGEVDHTERMLLLIKLLENGNFLSE